jgi:hypothetical protein
VLASESFAERRNLEPLGTIVAHAKVAEGPSNLHTVPGNAGRLALVKAGWKADDLDLVEINEAFAAVAINSSRILGVSEEIVNVNGGARKMGPIFVQIYGQGETPMTATYLRREEHLAEGPDELTERLASCGYARTGVSVAILDEENRELPRGQMGEICVRGPSVFAGYWEKPQETATTLKDDWLLTGRVAQRAVASYGRDPQFFCCCDLAELVARPRAHWCASLVILVAKTAFSAARPTLALVLPNTARLMDYIAAWWVACQLRPGSS